MTRKEKITKMQQLANGNTSKSIQRSKQNKSSKKGRRWSAEIALIAKRQLRFQKKTQKQLAEEMNVSPQQVNKWLSGKENFTIDTVAQLSDALGVPLLKPNLQFAEKATITTVKHNLTIAYKNGKKVNKTDVKPIQFEPKLSKKQTIQIRKQA